MNEITIVIQGPISHYLYRKLHNYKKYGKVLISTWDYVDVCFLPDYINIISKPLPDKSKAIDTAPPDVDPPGTEPGYNGLTGVP